MACQQALVTIQKVIVNKSESYGFWGEPGSSAEWFMKFTVAGHSSSKEVEGVRDGSVLEINKPFVVDLNSVGESLRVEMSGKESDWTSADDPLPTAEVIITPATNWTDGQTFEGSAANEDFEYKFLVDLRCAVAEAQQALVSENVRYAGLWNSRKLPQAQVWWPKCNEQQLRDKADKLWNALRFERIIPFTAGDDVWFSAVWNQGTYGQVWWPNCSEQQLRDKTSELWGSMRLAQMNPFVVGNEVRYSCIWNPGTHGQVWWPSCSEQQLRERTDELWGSMRLAQMKAFVVGNEVRYSCIWIPGTHAQVWWPNCSEQQLRERTDELWGSMRLTQMAPFVVGNEVRYNGIWNPGTFGQVWWPSCSEKEFRKKTSELWSKARIFEMQPFVA